MGGAVGTIAVPRNPGVKLDARGRDLLAHLVGKYQFENLSELARVVVIHSLLAGRPARDRAAAALYANSTMHAVAASSVMIDGMRESFASLASVLPEASAKVQVRRVLKRPGKGNPWLLRFKTDEFLHRRLERAVAIFLHLSAHGVLPPELQDKSLPVRLEAYARSNPSVLEGRSPTAEVLRWALCVDGPDHPDEVEATVAIYRRFRDTFTGIIGNAVGKARRDASEAIAGFMGEA